MDKRIETAWRMIQDEYSKLLTVKELSRRVRLSRSHFEFLFKRETGLTTKTCLQEVRLTHAVELLAKDHLSVKQVALSVGYGDVSNFTRDFKRRFGKTPSNPQIPQTAQIEDLRTRSG